MIYRLGADAIVLVHIGFVLFVVLGGLLVRWRQRIAWVHLAAVAWGAGIEVVGGICPLTPLENQLRRLGGQAGYSGDFVDRYLLPVLYPDGLTRHLQTLLAVAVLVVNAAIYTTLVRQARRVQSVPRVTKGGEG